MLKGPKISILIEPGAIGNYKLSIFQDDKLSSMQNYIPSDSASALEQLQYLMADVLSILAPDMKDTDEEVLYIVKCAGIDSKANKKTNFTFSGSTKH